MKGRAFHLNEISAYLADGGDPENISIDKYQGDPVRWSLAGLEIDTDTERHIIDYDYIKERIINFDAREYILLGYLYFKRGNT